MRIFRRPRKRVVLLTLAAVVAVAAIGGGAYATFGGGGQSSSLASAPIELNKGLVAQYKLDGNAKDSSSFGNNGTVTGATLTADRKGKTNGAYSVNSGQFINVPNNSTTTFGSTSNFSVSVWFKPTTPMGTYEALVAKGGQDNTIAGYQLFATGNNIMTLRLTWSGGNQYGVSLNKSGLTLDDGKWHLATAVVNRSSNTAYVYVDNNSAASTSIASVGDISSTANLWFGKGGAGNYDGALDEVRFYNRALSGAEVTALYNSYDSSLKTAAGQGGLVGQWKMDGNAKDATSFANNATVTSATLTTDREGNANSAYSFNGSSSYLRAPTVTSFQPTQAMSAGIWFKATNMAATAAQKLFSTTETGGYAMIISGSSAVANCSPNMACFLIYINGSYKVAQISRTSLTSGVWYHIYGTYDGTTVGLSINGTQVASVTATGAIGYNATTNLCIGAEMVGGGSCSTDYFDGSLDDMRLYNRALSATEINQQYDSYNSVVRVSDLQKGMVGDWAFNGNAKDLTSYGNNGTVTGATLTIDRKGRSNSAYSFGSASKIVVAHSASLEPQNISFALWVNPLNWTSGSNAISLISKRTATSNGYFFLYLTASNALCVDLGGSANRWVTGYLPPTGQWTHLAVTFNGTTSRLYVNGVSYASSTAASGASLASGSLLTLGQDPIGVGNYQYNGGMDDVRVYSRALSTTEVAALYASYR